MRRKKNSNTRTYTLTYVIHQIYVLTFCSCFFFLHSLRIHLIHVLIFFSFSTTNTPPTKSNEWINEWKTTTTSTNRGIMQGEFCFDFWFCSYNHTHTHAHTNQLIRVRSLAHTHLPNGTTFWGSICLFVCLFSDFILISLFFSSFARSINANWETEW